MSGVQQRKRPGVAISGFLTVCGVLALVATAPMTMPGVARALGPGPVNYPNTAAVALFVGALLMKQPPESPWRSFGRGMVVGGVVGLLVAFGLFVLFLLTWDGF